jgi:predicted XRE-type DNA-binding protein
MPVPSLMPRVGLALIILFLLGYYFGVKYSICIPKDAMTTLSDVASMLKSARRDAGLSQAELAQRAGVARITVARMETLANGDMSLSALVRLLEAAGYDLKLVKPGHVRTVEDILVEQRQGDDT